MKTILISGGTGLVGRHLDKLLTQLGYETRILTTNRELTASGKAVDKNSVLSKKYYFWDPATKSMDTEVWKNADALIHLAGANIGEKRWTESRRKLIYSSRVDSALFLYEEYHKSGITLKAFVSASAVGYYGSITIDKIYTEKDKHAHDFLGNLCHDWELAADKFRKSGVRTVILRTGVVLASDSEAFKKMLMTVKLGLGCPLGSGTQYMSWIHITDLCNIYLKALADENTKGIFNAVSPQAITNRDFMALLAKTAGKSFFMPAIPAFFIELFFGEMGDLIVEGSRIEPRHLNEINFKFRYDDLGNAFNQILKHPTGM